MLVASVLAAVMMAWKKGAAMSMLSMRSSTPPWPGSSEPESCPSTHPYMPLMSDVVAAPTHTYPSCQSDEGAV